MKLTGKCLDAFGDQCQYNYEEFMELPELYQNALIIEFFDSVGIKILIDTLHFQTWFFYKIKKNVELIEDVKLYPTRPEAIEKAIEKANTIYNEN